MSWIFLAILARLVWSFTNISEKYFVDKRFKNPYFYVAVSFLFGFLFTPFFIYFLVIDIYSFKILFYLFLAAIGFLSGSFFYIRALQKEEVSRINMMWSLVPLYSLFLAWFFIEEKLNSYQLFSLSLLVFGTILASIHFGSFKKFKFSSAFGLMSVACLLFSLHDVIFRYLTKDDIISFFPSFIAVSFFCALLASGIFLFKSFQQKSIYDSKNFIKSNLLWLVFGVTIFSKVGSFLANWAISLGPVSLVNAMEGFQMIMVFLIAILLSIFAPGIIKEELDKKNLLLKLIALVIMVLGIVVLNLL